MLINLLNQPFDLSFIEMKDMGEAKPSKGQIFIRNDLTGARKDITIYHELMHTWLHIGGFYDLARNETLVSHLSNCIFDLKTAHPELLI